MITVETCTKPEEWDEAILNQGGHPLQLWGWGEAKAAHGWRVDRVFVQREGALIGGAQLLIRELPIPFRNLVYVPRGPVAQEQDRSAVLEALVGYVKRAHKSVTITIEPDWEVMPEGSSWRSSANNVLIPQTLILDLSKSEEGLLSSMTKKTRQYIRKSEGEGIKVRKIKSKKELDDCLSLYKETAQRAGFDIHSQAYYHDVFDKLEDHSPVFGAFKDGRLVAFLWIAISQTTAFELYGGVNEEGQRLRANYILKWHAIRTTKRWGIERYDFNGLLNDGVSTFKRGFADHENMLAGAYDYPLSPLYILWVKLFPLAKKIVRKLKKR